MISTTLTLTPALDGALRLVEAEGFTDQGLLQVRVQGAPMLHWLGIGCGTLAWKRQCARLLAMPQVYLHGAWGSVCSHQFDERDASVACRQMGYSGGRALYGAGTVTGEPSPPDEVASMPVWLDDLMCRGSELSLKACRAGSSASGSSDSLACSVNEVAGVFCYGKPPSACRGLHLWTSPTSPPHACPTKQNSPAPPHPTLPRRPPAGALRSRWVERRWLRCQHPPGAAAGRQLGRGVRRRGVA